MNGADSNIQRAIIGGVCLILAYSIAVWRIIKTNRGDKFIECGSITLMVFVLTMAAMRISYFPSWVIEFLQFLLYGLALASIFFGAQQGYHALSRSKKIF
jgi:hypothetical protein